MEPNIKEKCFSVTLLIKDDQGKGTILIDNPRNDFLVGDKIYPNTVMSAYSLLIHFDSVQDSYKYQEL